MTHHPGFGEMLARLLRHRGADLAWLSASSGVTVPAIRSVIEGAPPGEPQLRALASAFGFRAADLFVMADVALPEDLTPLDPAAGDVISSLVKTLTALPPGQRLRIYQFAGELPREPRPRNAPVKSTRTFSQREAGCGAMLLSMLCGNRNLHPLDAAKTVAMLSRGRMYLSASTYLRIGHGRTPVRPEWLAGFAAVMGIPVGDLAAVTGIGLPGGPVRDHLLAPEMAELIWNLRRLSAAHARHLHDEAKAMLVPIPDGATDEEWNRVYHQHGVWWGAPRTDGE